MRSHQWSVQFAGISIEELRTAARSEMLQHALRYSGAYRDVDSPIDGAPIVMAGHQPSLFHPGVWFKNFALDHVAGISSSRRATAINLVIDNDVTAGSSVRVPRVNADTNEVSTTVVPFDTAGTRVPYEQNRIRDRSVFESFGARLKTAIAPIVPNPLVEQLWNHAKAAVNRCENASCSLAQARHALEATIGLRTLELPLSVLCRSEFFAAFALAVMNDLPRFREIHNRSLLQYRMEHRIRSNAHPVPELGVKDEWVEAPLWIYSDESPYRRPAWVRRTGGGLEISDLAGRSVHLSKPDHRTAAGELASYNGPNWKLRPRALLTTMYARMILSDLFIHGIGGAKYDQLGDQIANLFFAITPPEIMVVSATVLLPTRCLTSVDSSVEELKRQWRDSEFAPERFVDQVALSKGLLSRKRDLLASIPEPGNRKTWHDELTKLNRELSLELADLRASLAAQLVTARQVATGDAILRSREFSFCLFELEQIVASFRSMLRE